MHDMMDDCGVFFICVWDHDRVLNATLSKSGLLLIKAEGESTCSLGFLFATPQRWHNKNNKNLFAFTIPT